MGKSPDQESGKFPGSAPDFQNMTISFGRGIGYYFVQVTGYLFLDEPLLFVGRGSALESGFNHRLIESTFQNQGPEGQVEVTGVCSSAQARN